MTYLRYVKRRPERHGAPSHAFAAAGKAPLLASGTVKWFSGEKGYGFIAPADGSADVFVHVKMVHKAGLHSLEQGQQVEFELVRRPDGRAVAGRLTRVGMVHGFSRI